MPRASTRFRQADISRALKAARDAGQTVASCAIGADGKIEMIFGEPGKVTPIDPLTAWEDKQSARKT
jgi:hypothetical protein